MQGEYERLRTLSVPEAGKLLGLGRDASYDAAHRGDLPIVQLGKRLRVPVVALEEMLRAAGRKAVA